MKQKYTYSMPEEFMTDKSVPAHWRLLGILNGFFINGLEVYASNSWFQEQLGCSQKTISDAVSTLEKMGKITCKRTKRSRVITVGGSSQLLGGQYPTTISDSSELLPNSDSNSDNTHLGETDVSQVSDLPIVVVPDTPPKKKTKIKSEVEKTLDIFAEVLGKRPFYWKQHIAQRQSAENLYKERGPDQIRKALEGYQEVKDEPFCPTINSPYDLDSKWSNLYQFIQKHS